MILESGLARGLEFEPPICTFNDLKVHEGLYLVYLTLHVWV